MVPRWGRKAGTAGNGRLGEGARAALGLAGLLIAAAAIAGPAAILIGGPAPPEVRTERVVSAGHDFGGGADPFAWRPERREELSQRAAAGLSHVLYEHSPGGVVASARRTARWRDQIERAASDANADPDLIEAMVFLESAGRPDVIAGTDVEAASGLTQILAETGTGLLGMEIDLERSRRLTKEMAKASERGNERKFRRLARQRAAVDERFDPVAALAATGRYLAIARERFGREDLAVVSYHMGIGNLENVIEAYAGSGGPARELVEERELSYAQLFFDSSPVRNQEAWDVLSQFLDDSATYYWRVLAAEDIMGLYREDRSELERLAALHDAKSTQEEVFHPEDETEVFDEPEDVAEALESGEIVPLPTDRSLGFRIDRQMGEHARRLDQEPELYRTLRPEALATLVYLAAQVQEISGSSKPLRVTSTVRDRAYQEVLIGRNPEATREYSLHTTGWSFDILRKYANKKQARAFQFTLDRLRALALIDYAYEPAAIHITVSEAAAPLVD